MKKIITASSGFMLPCGIYFKPFDPKDPAETIIFNRTTGSSINQDILKFYQEKNVYRSETINKAYNSYIATKSFEDFINLINITIEIFKDIEFSSFFKMQASNVNLSNISIKFCLDVVSGKFNTNYRDYDILPFSVRFTISNGLTSDKSLSYIKEMESNNLNSHSWENFISELAEDKNKFLVFFRYIFVDYY